jgi:hypothetical protein
MDSVHICRFDSASDIVGKKRTYESVKARVLEAVRFSVFEATNSQKDARLFGRLCQDPEIETFDAGFPWTGVRPRVAPEPSEKAALMVPDGSFIAPASFDPYRDRKPYHYGAKMNAEGAKMNAEGEVSPLCAKRPRALNLNRELWTLRPEAVTCKRCRKIIGEQDGAS